MFYASQPISPYTQLPAYAYPESGESFLPTSSDTDRSQVEALGGSLSLKEKTNVQMHCIQITWTPPLHPPHWFVGGINLTENAQLYIKSIGEQVF